MGVLSQAGTLHRLRSGTAGHNWLQVIMVMLQAQARIHGWLCCHLAVDIDGSVILPSFGLQARLLNTPDVWINLLRELLHDKACRQALLKRSTEAVATPDEGMRLQLAVKLAERLAGASSKHRPSIYYSQLEPCLALGCGIPEAGQPSC